MNVGAKDADMKTSMTIHFNFTWAIIVLNLFCRISYGIHLHDDKFLKEEDSKERSTEIELTAGGVHLTQNEFTNPVNTLISKVDAHDDQKLQNDPNIAQLNLRAMPEGPGNAASINLAERDRESDLAESSEEMAARLGSSIELMKGQLFIQPGYHVIDVHKEVNSAFEDKDSASSTNMPPISSPPEVTETIDLVGKVNIDQPKIAETTPKKTNAPDSISTDSRKVKVADSEMKTTTQITVQKEIEEHLVSRPAVDEPTAQPLSFADCTSGEHDVHETEDGKIPSIGLEGSTSERIYHKMSSNLMESTNIVSDISTSIGVQSRQPESMTNPKVGVNHPELPENPAIVGQKEFVMSASENDAAMSAEDGETPLSLDAARSLASNMMTLLIRYDERQCAPGEEKCSRSHSEQSKTSESNNTTEYQQVILSDNSKEGGVKKIDLKNEGIVNASDETFIDHKKKERELSLLERIILGIRCARQDCRGVLNAHQDTANHSSQQQPQQQRKRRPVSTNWTIMRMKRFRNQILDDRRKRDGNVGVNVAGAKEMPERTDVVLDIIPESGDLVIDVSHLLNTLASCECQVSRWQRNFLRRMMLDDVGRARVIEALKKFINGGR